MIILKFDLNQIKLISTLEFFVKFDLIQIKTFIHLFFQPLRLSFQYLF